MRHNPYNHASFLLFYSLFHFLKYNHNCISVYYIMLGTNMAIL